MTDLVRVVDLAQTTGTVIVNNDTGEVLTNGNLSIMYAAPRDIQRMMDSPEEAIEYSRLFGIPLYADLDELE